MRNCPKPLRDPGAWRRVDGPPACPVLGVAPWFWDAVRIGALVDRGAMSTEIAASAWEMGEVAWHEIGQARAANAWSEKKRQDAIERLTSGRGNNPDKW